LRFIFLINRNEVLNDGEVRTILNIDKILWLLSKSQLFYFQSIEFLTAVKNYRLPCQNGMVGGNYHSQGEAKIPYDMMN